MNLKQSFKLINNKTLLLTCETKKIWYWCVAIYSNVPTYFLSSCNFVYFCCSLHCICTNKRFNDGVWDLLSVMNSWRIPLVFLISGIALRLSFQRRTKIEMLKERIKILIIPYIFGTTIFGTASLAIAFTYYEGWSSDYLWLGVLTIFDGAHLWFLKNIFIYCLILIPWHLLLALP